MYRISVRWYSSTLAYKNCVSEAWETGRMDDLIADSKKAQKEAVADIFRWRKQIDSIQKKLMSIASRKGKKNGR